MGTAFPPGPADRTGRFLSQTGLGQSRMAQAGRVHIELVAERLGPDVEIALALTATLLLRMADYAPTIHLVVPQDRGLALPLLEDTPLPDALATAHHGFSSQTRLLTGAAEHPDLRLVFSGSADGIAVSSAGWSVAVGSRLEGTGNALAAAYTGVLAAGEALKTLLGALAATVRTRPFRGTVSLWDYAMAPTLGPRLTAANLGEHAWVGAGGVASAAAWTLAALHATGADLSGGGIVVDHDQIDQEGTNLNRHLTASMADRGKPKARLLASLLRPAGLALAARENPWEELAPSERHPALAVVSVDDDVVRRTVQFDMPALILNAGTGDTGQYRATCHNLLDGACLACISQADKTVAGPEAALAARLALPLTDLEPYLDSTSPLPAQLLATCGLRAEERATAATVAGRDLLQHFCASLRLDQGPAVSIPMLSAAAGILLATELVKTATLTAPIEPGYIVRTNILTGPHARWRARREKTHDCPCNDELFKNHYRRLAKSGATAADTRE